MTPISERWVYFPKLLRLVPFSGQFSLCMREIGCNSTASIISTSPINSTLRFFRGMVISFKLSRMASVFFADFHFL
jgi:hypothetical protein